MRAYFATKLSPNISETPNGFLICKNVPIARTGEQEYLGYELDLQDERREKVVIVTREESEVFSPETLASFEGTIFCDEHPSDEVTTQNVQYLQKGFVKDVRRGSDADADKILADIIVTDPVTIEKIVSYGKREISCGYKCEYVEQDGKIYQKNIRGNHVALVDSGRAGKDVAIKDNAVKTDRRKEKFFMGKNKNAKRQSLLSKFMGIVTHDADPDVVGEIVEELVSGGTDEEAEPAPEKKEEAAPAPAPAPEKEESKDEDVMTLLKGIIERLDKLEASKGTDDDPLAELEKEVKAAAGAEAAEKPVEEMDTEEEASDEETADEGAALDEEGCDEEAADEEAPKTSSTGDRAAVKAAISDAKKAVAGIKDPKQRKAVADSMAKIIRQSYGIAATTPKNSYAAINAVKAKKSRAADSSKAINLEARQSSYDARNPHIKKK